MEQKLKRQKVRWPAEGQMEVDIFLGVARVTLPAIGRLARARALVECGRGVRLLGGNMACWTRIRSGRHDIWDVALCSDQDKARGLESATVGHRTATRRAIQRLSIRGPEPLPRAWRALLWLAAYTLRDVALWKEQHPSEQPAEVAPLALEEAVVRHSDCELL